MSKRSLKQLTKSTLSNIRRRFKAAVRDRDADLKQVRREKSPHMVEWYWAAVRRHQDVIDHWIALFVDQWHTKVRDDGFLEREWTTPESYREAVAALESRRRAKSPASPPTSIGDSPPQIA